MTAKQINVKCITRIEEVSLYPPLYLSSLLSPSPRPLTTHMRQYPTAVTMNDPEKCFILRQSTRQLRRISQSPRTAYSDTWDRCTSVTLGLVTSMCNISDISPGSRQQMMVHWSRRKQRSMTLHPAMATNIASHHISNRCYVMCG